MITNAIATSFKLEILQGEHEASDTYKIALIKEGHVGTYGAATTNVGTPGTGTPSASNLGTDEVSGTGYTTGGATLSGYAAGSSGTTVWLDWSDPSWATATIAADGAIIYNSTAGGKVVAVLDFEGTITSTAGTFAITFPVADASNALVRIN